MARQALDLLCSNLPAVARELGMSVETLRSYRTKRRTPRPETMSALATLMRERASALARLADQLDSKTSEG
jgi:hypothetical protein